jgi:hypothetical protein
MKKMMLIALVGGVLSWVAPALGEDLSGLPAPERPKQLLAMEPDAIGEQKSRELLNDERELERLVGEAGRIARVHEQYGTIDADFVEAWRIFQDKVWATRRKLRTLDATPADYAQSAMDEADAALEEARSAFSRLVDAAK